MEQNEGMINHCSYTHSLSIVRLKPEKVAMRVAMNITGNRELNRIGPNMFIFSAKT